MPHFEIVTAVAAPPDRVFEACLDVEAHTRSMADSSERAVGGRPRPRWLDLVHGRYRVATRFAVTGLRVLSINSGPAALAWAVPRRDPIC